MVVVEYEIKTNFQKKKLKDVFLSNKILLIGKEKPKFIIMCSGHNIDNKIIDICKILKFIDQPQYNPLDLNHWYDLKTLEDYIVFEDLTDKTKIIIEN